MKLKAVEPNLGSGHIHLSDNTNNQNPNAVLLIANHPDRSENGEFPEMNGDRKKAMEKEERRIGEMSGEIPDENV
ncbi:hypothetical protein Droror1_Dr00000347 [Drosera rotundifolia]